MTEIVYRAECLHQNGGAAVLSFDDRNDCIANPDGFAYLQCNFRVFESVVHGSSPYMRRLSELSRKPVEANVHSSLGLRTETPC